MEKKQWENGTHNLLPLLDRLFGNGLRCDPAREVPWCDLDRVIWRGREGGVLTLWRGQRSGLGRSRKESEQRGAVAFRQLFFSLFMTLQTK